MIEDENKTTKKNPFLTPENYFDQAELDIFNRINVTHQKINSRDSIHKISFRFLAIAASFLLIIVSSIIFWVKRNETSQLIITPEQIAYLEENLDDIDSETFIEIITASDIDIETYKLDNIPNN